MIKLKPIGSNQNTEKKDNPTKVRLKLIDDQGVQNWASGAEKFYSDFDNDMKNRQQGYVSAADFNAYGDEQIKKANQYRVQANVYSRQFDADRDKYEAGVADRAIEALRSYATNYDSLSDIVSKEKEYRNQFKSENDFNFYTNGGRSSDAVKRDIDALQGKADSIAQAMQERNNGVMFENQKDADAYNSEYLKQLEEIGRQRESLDREYATAKQFEYDDKIANGYRDATLKDLTIGGLKQGYNETALSAAAYDDRTLGTNNAQKYRDRLETDEYKFIPKNKFQERVLGVTNQAGQQFEHLVNGNSAILGIGLGIAGGIASGIPGAVVGYNVGRKIGSMTETYKAEAQGAYEEMIQNGVSEKTAEGLSGAVGAINAKLEDWQMENLIGSITNGVSTKLTTDGAKGAEKFAKDAIKYITYTALDASEETLQEMAQESVTIAANQIASKIDKGDWEYSFDEMFNRVAETGIDSFITFAAMGVGGDVLGASGRKAVSTILKDKKTEGQPVTDSQIAVAEIAEGRKATEQDAMTIMTENGVDERLAKAVAPQVAEEIQRTVDEVKNKAFANQSEGMNDTESATMRTEDNVLSKGESEPNVTDRRSFDAITEIGRNGKKAMQSSYDETSDTADYARDFVRAYNEAREGKELSKSEFLSDTQRQIASDAAKLDMDFESKVESVVGDDPALNGFMKSQELDAVKATSKTLDADIAKAFTQYKENNNETTVRTEERFNNLDGRGGTEGNSEKRGTELRARRRELELSEISDYVESHKEKVKFTSTAKLGWGQRGSTNESFALLPEEGWTSEIRNMVSREKAKGRTVIPVVGTMEAFSTNANKVTMVRAAVDVNSNRIWVQVDNPNYTAEQLIIHEDGHLRIKDAGFRADLIDKIRENGSRKLDAMIEAYKVALKYKIPEKSDPDYEQKMRKLAEDATDEILCDAFAGINIFAPVSDVKKGAEQFTDIVNSVEEKSPETNKAPPDSAFNKKHDGAVLKSGAVIKTSEETWKATDISKLREDLRSLTDENGNKLYTVEQINKWIKDVNGVAALIAKDRARLDYKAADNQTAMKTDEEYIYTVDFSTLCAKRLLYQGTYDAIQHALPNYAIMPGDTLLIRHIMDELGHQVPCGFCYVESRRKQLGKFAERWLTESGGKEKYGVTNNDVTTTDGLEKLRLENPEAYDDFTSWMRQRGSANPKVVELRTSYKEDAGILKLKPDQIEVLKKIGGLRIQSFSDFEIPHTIDMMQVIMDMARMNLTSQAYTKVPAFAEMFGQTGVKINLSVVADVVNGKLVFNDKEGMPHADAFRIRKKFDKTCGTILVGKNEEQIRLAMEDKRIDFIIPFHRSGWGKGEFRVLGLSGYVDFQNIQGEFNADYSPLSKERKKAAGFLFPEQYWNYEQSGNENTLNYLNTCREMGRIPRFLCFAFKEDTARAFVKEYNETHNRKISVDDILTSKGMSRLCSNNVHNKAKNLRSIAYAYLEYGLDHGAEVQDGYWKTLVDFRMYDNEGKSAKQEVVQPNFNMSAIRKHLAEYDGDPNKLPVAQDAVDQFVDLVKNHENGKYLRRIKDAERRHEAELNGIKFSEEVDSDGTELSEKQVEYFADSKIRNEDGQLIAVYHGSDADFTVFDRSKTRANMDIQGNFFSPWEIDAGGYGGNVRKFYLNITNPAPEGIAYKALNKFKGQNGAGIKAREYLESLGYDGVNNGDEEYIAFYPEQIKLADNYEPTKDPDVRFSEDNKYTYESLVQKDDMKIVRFNNPEVKVKEGSRRKRIDASELRKAAAGNSITLEGLFGNQSYVYIPDIKSNVLINRDGLDHGTQGNITNSSAYNTALITPSIPLILENSIAINELVPRTESDGINSKVLIGYAENEFGDGFIVKSTVNEFEKNKSALDGIEIYDVLKGSKAKKTGTKVMSSYDALAPANPSNALVPDTISIKDLLDIVKDNYPSFLSENVRNEMDIDVTPEDGLRFSEETDRETLNFLNNQEKVKVYRAMQILDGELYPPMAAEVKGEDGKLHRVEPAKVNTWYRADERPDLIDPKTGKFRLNKGKQEDGGRLTPVDAAYNPYWHTSATPLNDQFSSAYKRENLVVVEGYIPKSELTSGYKAEYAKDSVGETKWHAGPVASQLKGDKARRVFLSRWFMPLRVVEDSEVADIVSKTLEGENISVPFNVVTPSLRKSLIAKGVNISYDPSDKRLVNDAQSAKDADGIRFSEEVETEIAEKNKELRQTVAELNKALRRAEKAEGQLKRTETPTVKESDINKLAKQLIEQVESEIDRNELKDSLTKIANYILSDGNGDGIVYEDLKEMCVDTARRMVEDAKVIVNADAVAEVKKFRHYLKGQKFYLENRGNISEFSEFKKKNDSRFKITANSNDTRLDSRWAGMHEMFPDLIPEAEGFSDPTEMAEYISDLLDNIVPNKENLYQDYELAEVTEHFANSILESMLSEKVRQNDPTYADRMERKVVNEKIKSDNRAEELKTAYEEKLKRVRDRKVESIEAIKEHYRQVNADRVARRKDSAARTKLFKIAKRLKNRKLDAVTRAKLQEYIGDIDLVAKSMTGNSVRKLVELSQWYDEAIEEGKMDRDARIEEKLKRLSRKQISSLTQSEVADLTEVLQGIEHGLQEKNKLLKSEAAKSIAESRDKTIDDVNQTKGLKGLKYKVDSFFVSGTLSPERMMHRLVGYKDNSPLYVLTKELSNGQRKMLDFQRRAQEPLRKWTSDKKFMKSIRGADAELIEITGVGDDGKEHKVSITPSMRMSLYLHSKNLQNMAHVSGGGITVPDLKLYFDGDMEEAYARGTHIALSAEMVQSIVNSMPVKERAFADAASAYFNGMSQAEINSTSEALNGYSLANVEEYFPINTDSSFLNADYETVKHDGSIEGMGFLKERTRASNPIMLRDLDAVLEQSIRMTSKYVGLAIPVRNFQSVWNAQSLRKVDEYGNTLKTQQSVKSVIKDKWGSNATNYIDNLMRDVQGGAGRKSDAQDKLLQKIKSNYAGAILTMNISVAMKQAASYPTAGYILGAKNLTKALADFKRVDESLIAKYTPLLWYRSLGWNQVDLQDLKFDGKHTPKALNWIQGMDIATTKKLWRASEFKVREDNPNLKVGTDEYYNAVAEVYNRVIEETQPNYTVMQRPDLLRTDNTLKAALMMFKTQPFQNFNIMYDAIGNVRAKHNALVNGSITKDEYKLASKEATRAVVSQIAQLAVFSGMTMAVKLLMGKGKPYKDDDDEFDPWLTLLKDMGGSAASTIPFGGELWSALNSVIFDETYYGFDDVTASAISGLLEASINLANSITSVAGNLKDGEELDSQDLYITFKNSAKAFAEFAGIPANNMDNLLNRMIYAGAYLATQNKYLAELTQMSMSLSRAKKSSQYYDLLFKAFEKDPEAYNELFTKFKNFMGEDDDKIITKIENKAKKKYGVTKTEDLPYRYLTPDRQKEYDKGMGKVEKSIAYRKATGEQKKYAEGLMRSAVMDQKSWNDDYEKYNFLSEEEYVAYKLALKVYDKPNEKGKTGTYTKEEKEDAINSLNLPDGLYKKLYEAAMGKK